METEKKSTKIIENIINAKTKEDGLRIVNEILEILNLSNSYTSMVNTKNELEAFQKQYREISDKFTDDLYNYKELASIRLKLNFLYRDCVDSLSSTIIQSKIFFEESKSTRRAESIQKLKTSKEAEEFKAKTASALRDIVGMDSGYKQYVAESAISYSNYKLLENTLNSIRMMIDCVSSRERHELVIIQKDPK